MTVAGVEAWVTSAVEDKTVNKAIVLAGSLRRVRTAKKLAVLTTLAVSEELREKLKEVFDLVLLLEQKSPNGLSLEDYAKVQAFSLLVFNKCVYLSPNTLVLKNCDEIFAKYTTFAAYSRTNSDVVDPSLYLYVPNLDYSRALGKVAHYVDAGNDFTKYFNAWLQNQFAHIEKLEERFNLKLKLIENCQQSLNKNASIVNFVDLHPLDYPEQVVNKKAHEIGAIEKLAVDICWKIFLEDVKNKSNLGAFWPTRNEKYEKEPIAIVGMSFRLPGGKNVDEFWSMLAEGRSGIVPVPPTRWGREQSYIACKNRNVEAGFLTVPVDEFDAKFFGISPKEAEFLDPQQRLLHEVMWEALEDAMIDPLKLRGTQTGIYVGSWLHDYKDLCVHSSDPDFFRIYMGNSIAATSARLSHFLETTGPSVATESGCSSAIAAVDMACKSLRSGASDFAIACGVNLLLHSFENKVLEFVISPNYRCRTFDAKADGFARAEACAVLLLKRLSDAVKDNDDIWGLIRGTALTQEGVSKSLGTPTIQGESLAMELALKDAGVDPKSVSYIEAHGTGTPVGDPLEIMSIQKAYSKGRSEPLLIGSVKTNVGHTESVSGITGIIKVLLSMKNELIPQHLNLETLNPNINLEPIPAQIPMSPTPWLKRADRRRIAGVSSFGISGTDGHAIIEEPPEQNSPPTLEFGQERPLHFMKISAKSNESLEELLQTYQNIFTEKIENGESEDPSFSDIAYSANFGRATLSHRAVIIGQNFTDAVKTLKEKSFKQAEVQTCSSNLCFLFTGQGSQYPNMAKELYETSPIFKDSFDKCDKVLQKRYKISIKNVLWPQSESGEELSRTLYSQTSIFVVEYCLLKLWESWGVKADYVMGHSLGEFAAAVAAGALSFEDALMLVAERSLLIDSLPRGKMLVMKADKKKADGLIAEFQKTNTKFWVDYAALNSIDQTVVAGESGNIEEFSKFCGDKGIKSIVLAATHAFHSRHMNPMLEAYRKVASTVAKPEVDGELPKYISGMEGKLVGVEQIDAEYWVRHTREKVSFMEACKVVQQEGCSLFLEVGPHPVLSALVMMNIEGQQITCLPSMRRKEAEWNTMLESLTKLYLSDWKGDIDWKGFDRFYRRTRVKLPFYPFNRKPTWTRTERAYRKVHPLIGSILPAASTDTVFQNSMTLKNANFAQDHVIGNTVVFPGAGFLEMCLAGGHSTVQGFTEDLLKPRRPIILKMLKIALPLALYESGSCKLQTVITLDDKQEEEKELGYSVAVHRHVEPQDGSGVGRWILHASAKFLPVAPTLPKEILEPIDVASIQASWGKSDNLDFYEKLPEVGLRFGPKFQSLECGWKSEQGVLASVKIPEDHADYLIHPVVADAMIQSVMLWTSKEKMNKKLQVPVQIGEFIWLKEPESPSPATQFVYCSTSADNNSVFCTLLDENGTPLAYMRNVDFVETTAKLVEGMIHQQSTAMPNLWEDVWKNTCGPMQGALTSPQSATEHAFSEDDREIIEAKNNISKEELNFYNNNCNMVRYFTLKALYTLGWKPEVAREFTVDELMESLKIKENFKQQIRFFLRALGKEGVDILKIVDKDENTFKFVNTPPTLAGIEKELQHVTRPEDYVHEHYRIIKELGKNLADIFLGKADPLSILFPEDGEKPSASKFYNACRPLISNVPFHAKVGHHLNESEGGGKAKPYRSHYRVLEVGAGTGAFTFKFLDNLIPTLVEHDAEVEYYFTDVSAAFFNSAEKLLEKYAKYIVFKKFDMEKDPLEQGFCPGYFDAVLAIEVLHVAKDVKKTLKNLRSLLKPNGMIQILETICPDERITFVFGLLDGYWHFQDREFRKNHVTLTPPMWEEAFASANFFNLSTVPQYAGVHGIITGYAKPMENNILVDLHPLTNSWLIFGDDNKFSAELCRRISNVNRKCILVRKPIFEYTEESVQEYIKTHFVSASEKGMQIEGVLYLWSLSPDTRDQRQVSLPFVSLMKMVQELKNPPKTLVITKGATAIESSVVSDPTPATLVGLNKSLGNESIALTLNFMDLDPFKETIIQVEEVFMNLWVELKQSVSFRDGLRLSPKLSVAKTPLNEPLSLPSGCDRFQLVLPKTRLISDLEFGYLNPYTLADDEVEVHVKAMALNFRDVFAVLKPIPLFEKVNSVGLDFSGEVVRLGEKVTKWKVGDRVIGMNMDPDLSLPSHLKAKESRLVPLKEGYTFAEGCTLPAVFSTAVYCLLTVAQMKKGDTVLIHTASGGVGLVAIQLCQYVGANVIATAGSERKRAFLRNLGIQHVFHSRTTDFGKEIMEATGGRGVDIVLNSITGPGFKEASLDALRKHGKFIEMSKLNVWKAEEVKALRPDVFYELVDLTTLESDQYEKLTDELKRFLGTDHIKPIPFERFDALNIRGALNYLQKAKHIGKIVCIMPQLKLEKSKLTGVTPLCNEESTYLVTGGLGGIGFEVVRWMLANGAKHVAIASRSSPKPEVASQIDAWNKAGKHVKAFAVDIGDFEKCKGLLEQLKSSESGFPQLRGVMHAAGVLQDATFENQTWDKFLQTYNPKVNGSWNLHDLTKGYLLEHFVLFSSIAATFGSPGQANHSASNAFEDALAAYRRSNGLPATCVNWGNWGEVGVATEIDFPGIRPISTAGGLLALETFLKTQMSHLAVLNVDSFSLVLKLFPQVKHYVDDQRLLGDSRVNMIINSAEFWNEVDSADDREGKVLVFKNFIKNVVRTILKMDADENIEDQTEFQALGIDSLMMLEMKNSLQNILGSRMTITASQLKDCNNTESLANTLVDILEGEHDSEKNIPTPEELRQLIRDDSNLLPGTLTTENLEKRGISQVETVLLTGATGNVGPYLLRDLTLRRSIKKVYCLIRPSGKIACLDRLTQRLEQMQLIDTIDVSKVEVVEGDIASPKLGLDETTYSTLCEGVDAIIHSAVKADHTASYWKAPDTRKSHLRTINVLGTVRLLEMAAEKRLKHFYYASTILTFAGMGRDGEFSEGWQAVEAFDTLTTSGMGYILSKHICEQLVYDAVTRGVPCKAFRLPYVAGDSITGRVDYLQNHGILRWLTCMKVGVMHDLPMPFSTLAVDHCAKISLDIFFNPEAPMDVYNVIQKEVEVEQVIVEVAQNFGVEMELVSYDQFVETLKAEDENSPISALIKTYVEGSSRIIDHFESPSVQVLKRYLEDSTTFVDISKVKKYFPGYENFLETTSQVLMRDLTYLKEEGVFEKFGIKTATD